MRNLITAGHIAPGEVDERSIEDVRPDDLVGYTQCHFFAGIGGWSYALRLAGWPDDKPVWTGSCPCQPFSTAGKQDAEGDARDLWPTFFGLIRKREPSIVFGEQVAGAIHLGWYDRLHIDMESAGYAVGAANLPACGVGAPHVRPRLYFVANSMRRDKALGWDIPGSRREPEPPAWNTHWQVQSEPAILDVANGLPQRMGVLRALGNAIVPQVAAAFIRAAVE